MQSRKNTIKKIVDAGMTVLLLCLMAYQVTGEALHEWIGIGMTVVLIVHHILNIKWYAVLFKGKYNAYRIVTTIVNVLLLVSIALNAFCGMSMSSNAVPFLYGMADMVFARTAHLALSYWSFLLMGIHLGLHLPAMTAKLKPNKTTGIIVTAIFTVIAGIGLWLFIRNGIPAYISFQTHFAFFDYDKSAILVFAENMAELFFFAFIGANAVRIIRNLSKTQKKNPLVPVACVLLAVIIGLVPNLVGGNNGSQTSGWDVPQNTSAESLETNEKMDSDKDADGMNSIQSHIEPSDVNDGYILLSGGTFLMGSPETENWRIDDELQHEMKVSSFYMDP